MLECLYIVHELSLYYLAPCGSPGGLTVNYVLPATTAKLSWTPVPAQKQNGVITGYTVHVVRADLSSTSRRDIPVQKGDATSVDVPNLTPFTSYSFSISAKTNAGAGPPSASISSKTPETGS